MNGSGFSRVQSSLTGREHLQVTRESQKAVVFTPNDLHRCLYRKNEVILLNKEDLRTSFQRREEVHNYWCRLCHQEKPEICQKHGPHQVVKIPTTDNNSQWSYAMESFPNEVSLCKSGLPGAGYGVCAKQLIPVGTWIGPYEGEKVRPDQVSFETDASYMWEIYHEGKLVCYIDGRDENKSSWMRYIRCARYCDEQNMFAFQYYGNIYYRAFRDIPPGDELLVWYDEKYPQYMGIPLEIRETSPGSPTDSRQHTETMVVVTQESPQGSAYGYPSSSRPLTDNQHSPNPPSTSVRPPKPSYHSSRNESHGSSRGKSRTSQNISSRRCSRTSLTAENYDMVGHYETDTRFNEPTTTSFYPKEVSLERDNRATSFRPKSNEQAKHTGTNGHHEGMLSIGNQGDEPNVVPSVAEESQSRLGDDEDNSSDGSDSSFFNCGQCGKSFAQRSVLQIHVCPNRPHKPYHCGHCTQSFDHPTDLRMHAVIHAGEKPFKCGYCSRSFAGATTLHNHVRTHTGEKPFLCERCGKTFTQASQLHRHEAIPGDCKP